MRTAAGTTALSDASSLLATATQVMAPTTTTSATANAAKQRLGCGHLMRALADVFGHRRAGGGQHRHQPGLAALAGDPQRRPGAKRTLVKVHEQVAIAALR